MKETTLSTSETSYTNAKDYLHRTGELRYPLTNDALFHIVFERNPQALHALLCSLLSMEPSEIISVEVTNPIQFGESVYTKDFILDLKVEFNNHTMVNIEMQVLSLACWRDCSLGYLCRTYDNLNKGQDYADTKPAIQVGILDFEVFPGDTEFYATYHLANDLTHKIYSDKFRLSVLQLRQIKHATEDDKRYKRQLWAQLFKATTWEEIRMLAEQDPILEEILQTMSHVTDEKQIRYLCEGRREGIKTHNTLVIQKDRAEKALADAQAEIADAQAKIAEQTAEIAEQKAEIAEQTAEIAEQKAEIAEQKAELEREAKALRDKYENELHTEKEKIAEKDATIEKLSDLLIKQITKKVQANKSLKQIADEVELPEQQIKELYECIKKQFQKDTSKK